MGIKIELFRQGIEVKLAKSSSFQVGMRCDISTLIREGLENEQNHERESENEANEPGTKSSFAL